LCNHFVLYVLLHSCLHTLFIVSFTYFIYCKNFFLFQLDHTQCLLDISLKSLSACETLWVILILHLSWDSPVMQNCITVLQETARNSILYRWVWLQMWVKRWSKLIYFCFNCVNCLSILYALYFHLPYFSNNYNFVLQLII